MPQIEDSPEQKLTLPVAARMPCRWFLLPFIVVFSTALALMEYAFEVRYPNANKAFAEGRIDQELLAALRGPLVNPRISSAEDAKKHEFFWANSGDGELGAAVDVLSSPSLFQGVFPGYPESMRQDRAFWRTYFKLPFSPDSYVPELSEGIRYGVRVRYAWTGCFQTARDYGADVVILGTSEVYRAIIPSLLHKRLRNSGIDDFQDIKILMCAGTALPSECVAWTARELRSRMEKKIDLVIWGFSFWQTFLRSDEQRKFLSLREKEFRLYWGVENRLFASFSGIQDYSLAHFLSGISWNSTLKASHAKVKAKMMSVDSDVTAVSPLNATPVSMEDARDPVRLASAAGRVTSPFHMLRGVSEPDCHMEDAGEVFDSTLSALLELGERAFVYLPPTTDLTLRAIPPCLAENARGMASSRKNERVEIMTASWKDYGLRYEHYLQPDNDNRKLTLDRNHVNILGALIVTNRLADRIIGMYRTGEWAR